MTDAQMRELADRADHAIKALRGSDYKKLISSYSVAQSLAEIIEQLVESFRTASNQLTAGTGLREALEPFARALAGVPASVSDAVPFARVSNDAKTPGTMNVITFGEFRRLIAALTAPAVSGDVREVLKQAREEIVLTIAFLGRDAGTDRIDGTIKGLTERLAKVDAAILAALPPSQETKR
jgi:hypothetical protein